MPEKKNQPQQVPNLVTLAAEVIKKTNPHLFFTLYENKKLRLEIENKYINPPIKELVNQHEEIYLAKVKERKETVNERSASIEGNTCYRKCTSIVMTALGSGVHLGVYYILRASGVPYSTTLTFLATIPATMVVTACFSPCASILLAKGMARCVTPGVPPVVVDLTEVVTDIESKKHNP